MYSFTGISSCGALSAVLGDGAFLAAPGKADFDHRCRTGMFIRLSTLDGVEAVYGRSTTLAYCGGPG